MSCNFWIIRALLDTRKALWVRLMELCLSSYAIWAAHSVQWIAHSVWSAANRAKTSQNSTAVGRWFFGNHLFQILSYTNHLESLVFILIRIYNHSKDTVWDVRCNCEEGKDNNSIKTWKNSEHLMILRISSASTFKP